MPLPDHVVNAHKGSGGNGTGEQRAVKSERRRAIPVDVDDASPSLLSPLMSHLPSLSGISSLKGFLPAAPGKQGPRSITVKKDAPRAIWQEADLGDGHGKSDLLILSSPSHALQIFRYLPGPIPEESHAPEIIPSPEEVFNLPSIRCDGKTENFAVDGVDIHLGEGKVIGAHVIDTGRLFSEHGPVAAVVTLLSQRESAQGALALVLVSLSSGKAIKYMSLGVGSSASVVVSKQAIVVSMSHPTTAIHILDPYTLAPMVSPLMGLPVNPVSGLPVFALAGRLLAHATSTPPVRTGPEGLGALVTARSTRRAVPSHPDTQISLAAQPLSTSESAQAAILASAVEIGGGVARGVWAGLKMGARAANQARTNRMARSAPAEASGSLADVESEETLETEAEPRSYDERGPAEELLDLRIEEEEKGGEWIRILDIRPQASLAASASPLRTTNTRRAPSSDTSVTEMPESKVIAHFRSPPSNPSGPTDHGMTRGRVGSNANGRPVTYLSFNPLGTQLLVAPEDGRAQHVFEIHSAGADRRSSQSSSGEVWHLYELRRGTTAAKVIEVKWAHDGRWVGVQTDRGTIHVFPINPTGGPASAATHVSTRPSNPQYLYPLSPTVFPGVRIRPRQTRASPDGEAAPASEGPGCFAFSNLRKDPQDRRTVCQDVVIYRKSTGQLELCRLMARPFSPHPTPMAPGQRRASALTEMMRTKAFGEGSDLEVKKAARARWAISLGGDGLRRAVPVDPVVVQSAKPGSGPSLAHAEIQTYCIHPRVLPGSIYLSRQIEFFSARPIDDFSPLSIMDIEARTKRLMYRQEVEARPVSLEAQSFDEPLLSALHSMIESPSSSQIPGLPNGSPGMSRWRNIPIRPIAAGLGESVDRVRREYVRAQHSRARRRAGIAAQNGLSFEDETVFASQTYEDEQGSSPSSALMPTTNTESSGEGDDEWNVGWEEEYARAVEDDGGPEELVLGLMDEEEEERRTWAVQPKPRYR